ncbi:MAG: DUF5652 family protein [Patescibacteria group bacterium]
MNQLNPFFMNSSWIFLPVVVWILFWKGCSLWIAAKNDQKGWFLALLVFNTVGILEIIYIFYVAKKKWVDIREILTRNKPLIK